MKKSKQIVTEFLERFLDTAQKQDTLLLNFTTPKIFDIHPTGLTELKIENDFSTIEKKKFDLVIGDLPFGMQSVTLDTVSKIKVNKNWSYVLTSLRKLKDNGQAFFLIEPSILFSQQGKKFLTDLTAENFFINSVFEVPEKLLYPETIFQPIIIQFERQRQGKLFIAEITADNEGLFNSLNSRTSSNSLESGILVERKNFNSFSKFRIENEINNLQTQYEEYSKYQLKDVATEINLTRVTFNDKPNSIYIPKIGTSLVASDIALVKIKHQNLFQVVLKTEIVKAEFLALFFHSELGRQILKSLVSGSIIPNINKSDIGDCFVSIPKLAEQDLIIRTYQKLSELQETIDLLKTELSLNPKNANVILDKFESIQNPLKQLSIEDQTLSLIRKGENKHIEFKETFSKSVDSNKPLFGKKDTEVEKASLKTIVGFLNADGGTLLIGVNDNGEITGVDDDFFVSPDKYKLNFNNAIKTKIGSEFYSLIDYDLFDISGRHVLRVDCKPAIEPCFFNLTEFFVRTNPATDKLEGKKLNDYIKTRFK
ncbi:MAG: N-6 DNA methylase [Chlorobiales bacterium]|nr:N-6 DNA methylase [Chlorobiales bacterium]